MVVLPADVQFVGLVQVSVPLPVCVVPLAGVVGVAEVEPAGVVELAGVAGVAEVELAGVVAAGTVPRGEQLDDGANTLQALGTVLGAVAGIVSIARNTSALFWGEATMVSWLRVGSNVAIPVIAVPANGQPAGNVIVTVYSDPWLAVNCPAY